MGGGGVAILSACHIQNKVPHKKTSKTPYEFWERRKPNLEYLRVWGCLAKVMLLEPKKTKLGSQTCDCVFVGYASNSSCYIFLVIKSDILESVRTYVIHLLGIYVTILCNWLILWQNALYLYLGRSKMCLILQETLFQNQVLKPCKSV